MKKIFTILGVIGILMSSCSKIENQTLPSSEEEGVYTEITASFEETRTSIDEGWKTSWDKNDKMVVYYTRETSGSNYYGYSNFTYAGEGKFTGSLYSRDKSVASPYNWFAVYPSKTERESYIATELTPTITHPASQTMRGTSNAHIAANDPVFGYVLGQQENAAFVMHHTASVLVFNITNGAESPITVTNIEFTAPDNIVGDFTAESIKLRNITDKSTTITPNWTGGSSKTVTLTVEEGEEIAKEGSAQFYAAIHPLSENEASGSYTIKVTATMDGKTVTSTKTISTALTFTAGTKKPVNFTFVPSELEEKTYKKVTNISEGTYIICGYESEDPKDKTKKGTYVCLFPPVDAESSSIKSSNRCNEYKFSDSNTITEIKTSDASIIGSEVEIIKSGSKWLVKYKANGLYMYYNNGAIAFTSDATSAAQTISLSSSSGRGPMKSGSYEFYHSGTDKAFGYTADKNASNLMFFKFDGSTPPTPPTEKSYAKVTKAPDDWSGTYLIVDESAKKAFDENATNYAAGVTITNSTIEWSEDIAKYEVTISKSPDGKAGHYDVKTRNEKYLYRSSSDKFLNDSNYSNKKYSYAIIGEKGMVSLGTSYNNSSTYYYFRYSSNSKAFGFSNDKSNRIQLYKLQQ